MLSVPVDRVLVRALRRAGAPIEEIDRASDEGWLTLLAIDRVLLPGPRRYSALEVSDRAGIDPELALRLWRTMGFPEPPLQTPMFTDEAASALEKVVAQSWRRDIGPDAEAPDRIVSTARAVSAGLAKVAESLSDELAAVVHDSQARGFTDEQIARSLVDFIAWDELRFVQDYALRSILRAALWRKIAAVPGEHGSEVTVGFLDLVGFTAKSLQLSVDELEAMVKRFEAMSFDIVASHGGRTVKTIGDEVMFVADEPSAAANIALALLEGVRADPLLPDGRAGLATGPTLSKDGDHFGPIVNLAARLAEVARPRTVLAEEHLYSHLESDERFLLKRAASRRLRDVGRQRLWVIRRNPTQRSDRGEAAAEFENDSESPADGI